MISLINQTLLMGCNTGEYATNCSACKYKALLLEPPVPRLIARLCARSAQSVLHLCSTVRAESEANNGRVQTGSEAWV